MVGLTSVSPKLFNITVLAEFYRFLIVLLLKIMIIDYYQMGVYVCYYTVFY